MPNFQWEKPSLSEIFTFKVDKIITTNVRKYTILFSEKKNVPDIGKYCEFDGKLIGYVFLIHSSAR